MRSNATSAPADPVEFTPCFSRKNGEILCEGVPLTRIAARFGTPVYVYSTASLASAYRTMDRAFRGPHGLPHPICYSVKANSNLSVLRLLHRLGSRFDIVSGGELFRLLEIGVPARKIVFSGVGKTREEIREALRAGILLFNVESAAELEMLAAEAARARRAAPAGIRVNPDVEARTHPHISTGHHLHKFGVDWPDARRLYLRYKNSRWIAWRGISMHIGSQILSVQPFRAAANRLAAFARELAAEDIHLKFVDFGGGVGIRYWKEKPLSLEIYARTLARALRPLGCTLLLEPGRMIAGPAGVLLMRVLHIKRSRGKKFVIVDAAMNDFLRPSLYGAVHPVTPAVRKEKSAPRMRADIVGPVCETGDFFLHNWPLPEVQPGDVLALWGAGAYGFVSASNYNSRPRPAEVLVDGKRARLIRRRETRRDLIRGEK